ncbi:hypothetical protein [Roseovarius aquimarinus]|uniref:PDZ domain-containing protein n=1 Tax=Roseovarius aquimarinus TaxID=1229156 RepID=A0ABW7I753_9RHOB
MSETDPTSAPAATPAGAPPAPPQGVLALTSVHPAGRALGLRKGDLLTRIDGRACDGRTTTLSAAFRTAPTGRCILEFRRAGRGWCVRADTPALGRWRTVPAPAPGPERDLRGLRNWEVMVAPGGQYDAQPQDPGLLPLLAPVHMIHMRLWAPLAIWAALLILCLPLGWLLGGLVQIIAAIYFWRAAPALVRADRVARGYRLWGVVAARSEAMLHRQIADLAPDMPFVHAPPRAPA